MALRCGQGKRIGSSHQAGEPLFLAGHDLRLFDALGSPTFGAIDKDTNDRSDSEASHRCRRNIVTSYAKDEAACTKGKRHKDTTDETPFGTGDIRFNHQALKAHPVDRLGFRHAKDAFRTVRDDVIVLF